MWEERVEGPSAREWKWAPVQEPGPKWLCRSQRCCLPEGCLLCCPVPLMFWRAGAGCCCVHWTLPLASFPAHCSFVWWGNNRGGKASLSLQERLRGLILMVATFIPLCCKEKKNRKEGLKSPGGYWVKFPSQAKNQPTKMLVTDGTSRHARSNKAVVIKRSADALFGRSCPTWDNEGHRYLLTDPWGKWSDFSALLRLNPTQNNS